MNCKIQLSEKATKSNKKLIKYLEKNIDHLNRKGCIFSFRILKYDEIKLLAKELIKLPFLVIGNIQKMGSQNIIDCLDNYRPTKSTAESIDSLGDDEAMESIHNMQYRQLKSDNDRDDDEETKEQREASIQKKMNEYKTQRERMLNNGKPLPPPIKQRQTTKKNNDATDRADNVTLPKENIHQYVDKNNTDDVMLANMFELS